MSKQWGDAGANALAPGLLPQDPVAGGVGPGGKKPNVIFVLVKSLGIGSLSCDGADIFQTPDIDRLAEGGMRFTHCYTSPLTGPSRAVMLTGRYPLRTGATNAEATGQIQPATETMLPKFSKRQAMPPPLAANGASRRAVRMRIRRVFASHRQRVLKHAER